MDARDRDSTHDWLIPEEALGTTAEPAQRPKPPRPAPRRRPPEREPARPPKQEAMPPRETGPPSPSGNGAPRRPVPAPSDQVEALRIAARAAESAQSSAATALAAAEIADESSIRVKRSERQVQEVAQRAGGVLSAIEGRERAARRRAREAAREEVALQAIAERADRILEHLRRLAA